MFNDRLARVYSLEKLLVPCLWGGGGGVKHKNFVSKELITAKLPIKEDFKAFSLNLIPLSNAVSQ